MLSYCPGGIYEVAVISIFFDRDPEFVSFHHIIRLLMILFIVPIILQKKNNPNNLLTMRILYCGKLEVGSTSLSRFQAIAELGHHVIPIDTSNYIPKNKDKLRRSASSASKQTSTLTFFASSINSNNFGNNSFLSNSNFTLS